MKFYGTAKRVQLNQMESAYIDPEEAELVWKIYWQGHFVKHEGSSLQEDLSWLLGSSDLAAAFPNLAKLASVLELIPVTTATVDCTFSSIKLTKSRLRSRMGQQTLDHAIHYCIEGRKQMLQCLTLVLGLSFEKQSFFALKALDQPKH